MKAKPKIQPEGHLFGKLDLVRKILIVLPCKVTSLFAEDDIFKTIHLY